jgi:L-lactate dehydrogenase complex protein LldG
MTAGFEVRELFQKRFEELAGVTHTASNSEEACDVAVTLLNERKVKRIVKTRLATELESRLLDMVARSGMHVIEPKPTEDLISEMNNADVGISMAQLAIAETGTIGEVVFDDFDRLVSSLPPVHVVFVRSHDLLSNLTEAATLIQQKYASQETNYALTFISDPSRTADIEMRLVLGVHGPLEVHAIIFDGGVDS